MKEILKNLFITTMVFIFTFGIVGCNTFLPNNGSSSSSSENLLSESVGEIPSTQLFDAGDVPVYNSTVGGYKGVMVGWIGSDTSYGIDLKKVEDFEVPFRGIFKGDAQIEYIYPLSQWSSTQFIVCDLEGNELFGGVHDWISLGKDRFFDIGYLIDYRQTPHKYFAQGNTYNDLYEAKLAKHTAKPIYDQAEESGTFDIKFINDSYVKVSMSESNQATRRLETIFEAKNLKDGYIIKIKDARQMILDYREETGENVVSQFRTCVLIVSVNGINIGGETTELFNEEDLTIAYPKEYQDENGNSIIEIKQGESLQTEFYIAKRGYLIGQNGKFETTQLFPCKEYAKFSHIENFKGKAIGEYPFIVNHGQTGLTKKYIAKVI